MNLEVCPVSLGGNPRAAAELRTEVWELRPGDAQVAMPRKTEVGLCEQAERSLDFLGRCHTCSVTLNMKRHCREGKDFEPP